MTTTARPVNPEANPVINDPYHDPQWHWELDSQVRAVNYAVKGRRPSQDIPPIVGSRAGKAGQRSFTDDKDIVTNWPELKLVNAAREAVAQWKADGYPGVTAATRRLLNHWTRTGQEDEPSDNGLYHAQLDAALTHIYLTEGAQHKGYPAVKDQLDAALADHLRHMGGIERICHKMATGTGKTTVMAMLILYQAANHAANPDDPRFTNRFLIICPNTTVRDRLRPSLIPSADERSDDYSERDLLPHPHELYRSYLNQASIAVANWHQLQPKNIGPTFGSVETNLLRGQDADCNPNAKESELQAVLRAAGLAPDSGPVMVLNDEAHHCHYGDPKRAGNNPNENSESTRTEWLKAIVALKRKEMLHGAVADLSATPFFLKSARNTLYPWIVSDCGLIEAQEAGLTKIPRAPVSRDKNRAAEFRNIYDHTPSGRQGHNFNASNDDNCRLLKEALNLAAEDYTTEATPEWRRDHEGDPHSAKLPAMAIVADKVINANAIYQYVAYGGIECSAIEGEGGNPFANFQPLGNGQVWRDEPPRTIVVHSEINNSDYKSSNQEMRSHCRDLADRYREYYEQARHPDYSDDDVIRLVMNSVGKPGEPGENVRCVISVSMLAEGWDARNVTHLVGLRPFKSSLLCEQVAGRTLRRSVWDPDENGRLSPEYACVLGIPFREKPDGNRKEEPDGSLPVITVATPPDRSQFAIQWPNIIRLDRVETDMAVRALTKTVAPTDRHQVGEYDETGMFVAPIIGAEQEMQNNPPNSQRRFAYEIAGQAAQMLIQDIEREDLSTAQLRVNVLFCDLLRAFEQHLTDGNMLPPHDETKWPSDPGSIADAAHWLHRNVEYQIPAPPDGRPPMAAVKGRSRWLDTELRRDYTIRDQPKLVYSNSRKTHANHAKCDSSWETVIAKALDESPEVTRWARNNRLGWEIPYVYEGQPHAYQPDFVAVAMLPDGRELHLVIEVKGMERESDRVKRRWTESYWLPAVNADPEYSEGKVWRYLYITEEAMYHPRQSIETKIMEERAQIS